MSEVSNNVITSKSDPAFPSDPRFPKHMSGMSIRDYFAGQAIVGLLASERTNYSYNGKWIDAAKEAYEIAEAMLVASIMEEVQ